MSDIDEILVAVDGSESARNAARFAARLAAAFNIPCTLAYVVQIGKASSIGMAKMSSDQIEAMKQQQARPVFEDAHAAIGAADAGELILFGDPAEEILGHIAGHPNTLVVMGRRGLSRVQSMLLGSVSERVMRESSGAVTIVN